MAGIANAQFELTPTGFIDKNNKDKDYLVLEVAGKSKADLYKSTLVYLNSLYSNAKDAISKVDGESISVTALDDNTISPVFNKYTFSFEFKDGKIKVNQPAYSLYFYPNGQISEYQLYTNKGKFRKEKDKDKLEAFYNGYVAIIKKNAEKKSEDW